MTVTTPVFVSHLKYLQENGYTVILLRQLVVYRLGDGPPPPLTKSKATLEKHLSIHVNTLAWPFGIYDEELMKKAAEAGYVAALCPQARADVPQSLREADLEPIAAIVE